MFIVFINKASIYKTLLKMLKRAFCHCNHNTKDCFQTVKMSHFNPSHTERLEILQAVGVLFKLTENMK